MLKSILYSKRKDGITKMKPYETLAHIHSLKGEMDTVTVLDKNSDGTQTIYIVDYKGVKCTAIFNPFVCEFYADDKYGLIKEKDNERC